jgi:hypothetical protein
VVGDRGEHHRLDGAEITPSGERGGEHTLGRVARSSVDEAAVPLRQALRGHCGRRQGRDREARWLRRAVASDEHERVDQRGGLLVLRQLVDHVRHRDEHGETGAPSGGAVRAPELQAGAHDLGGRHTELEQREHRLRDHEREASFQAVAEPVPPAPDLVAFGAGAHEHVVAGDLDLEALGVVGPQVEGAARLEIEPCVVPVAGHETGVDGALVQREAHVGAPVLDRERPPVVPEHHDRQVGDLGDELPGLAELVGGSGACARDHGATSFPVITASRSLP